MGSVNLLDEDLVLWNMFRNGDAGAFGELMHLHYTDLFNYGTRFTRETELVKDCIQDLFLSLWKNKATVNETSFVKYYLLKSLRRKLSRSVHKKRYSLVQREFEFENLFNEIPSVETNIIVKENLSELALKMRRLLANLSKRQQEVIYLRFYMDADIEEIAEITSLNRQSVYNLLHDAIKKLKKISLQKDFTLSRFTPF
jgi:RNA polymerase sigma factor (sigma-70 family)